MNIAKAPSKPNKLVKTIDKLGDVFLNVPYLLWAAIFIIVPLIIVVYYAFTDSEGVFSFSNIASLGDYADIFLISIEYSFIATAISLLIAYPFSYIMSRLAARAQRTMMMLVMLPMWMNMLIRTYSWMNILERNGIINNLLESVGLRPLTLIGTPGAVIFGMVYNYLPYMILPIYSIMAKISAPLLEAADDLGATGFQRLRRVVLPLSLPGVISGVAMVFVPSISTFYISQQLGNGKIKLIGDIIEQKIQYSYNYNLGAALSLVLMVFILITMAIANRFTDESDNIIV